MKKVLIVSTLLVVAVAAALAVGFRLDHRKPKTGTVLDEAMTAGRAPESLRGADEDYFRDMDYGITQDPEAVRGAIHPYVPGISAADAVRAVASGRNNWLVWTGGNDRFWDEISRRSLNAIDLLKTISSHPSLLYGRRNRWRYLGLINEPCYREAKGPRKDRFGLWLDERVTGPGCTPDPFEHERKYPGVKIGARGKNLPVGSYYGYGTGIIGLRLFPNPAFDEEAQEAWDAERYYTDPEYYDRKDLVKPYRVGMSCGFCHAGPNPTRPPADPENPAWANLNSNPGAQYSWTDRIFFWPPDDELKAGRERPGEDKKSDNFIYQLLHTYRPGALDTSFVASDNVNNPRAMNAVYNLGPRLAITTRWGKEELDGGGRDNRQFNDYPLPPGSPLARYYRKPDKVFVPRVLKDGADSVGALGALNRVFMNIGMFSEEWLLHFIPMVGGPDITPMRIADARRNSSYWLANEAQTPNTALFFLATARPDSLREAEGGAAYLADGATLQRGKVVFAARCARCHSSKLPPQASGYLPDQGCAGPDYLRCWNEYWQWTKSAEFRAAMRAIVLAPDFLDDNFLSTELRVPVTLLQTNACSPLASNAIEGNIWDNFSSRSYKSLPPVGKVRVHHPYTGRPSWYTMPGGGRGYTRPPSLVSLWSTAPYLLNNTVGTFYGSGSVADRMKAFDDGIRKLLWPERREGSRSYETASGKAHPGIIDVTTTRSYLVAAPGFLPGFLAPLTGLFDRIIPNVFDQGGGARLGPIPQGTPVNLLANIDLQREAQVLRLLLRTKRDLQALPKGASDEEARKVFRNLVEPLLAVSKCPDFVVNRGHYFGTDFLPPEEGEPGLSDQDKLALIEFLKTL